ncbi:DUF4399 domain-containing protein [Prosthecomicrobium sp. N25]|uniref:DUF4399 domain-containing protein n=1 Tax=Prosthecomicrobium sp. N25 TaxID=3129254 RepID=UPI0030774A0C
MRRRALAAGIAVLAAGAVLTAAGAPAPAAAQEAPTAAPKGAIVYFHNLRNGQRLPKTFWVRIGLKEMGVAPAGVRVMGTGHHHILVDADMPPAGQPIPSDFNHVHLGGGQTEAQLTLTPGRHTLQLLVGDHAHIPHVPPIKSERITVTVSE